MPVGWERYVAAWACPCWERGDFVCLSCGSAFCWRTLGRWCFPENLSKLIRRQGYGRIRGTVPEAHGSVSDTKRCLTNVLSLCCFPPGGPGRQLLGPGWVVLLPKVPQGDPEGEMENLLQGNCRMTPEG